MLEERELTDVKASWWVVFFGVGFRWMSIAQPILGKAKGFSGGSNPKIREIHLYDPCISGHLEEGRAEGVDFSGFGGFLVRVGGREDRMIHDMIHVIFDKEK